MGVLVLFSCGGRGGWFVRFNLVGGGVFWGFFKVFLVGGGGGGVFLSFFNCF